MYIIMVATLDDQASLLLGSHVVKVFPTIIVAICGDWKIPRTS